MQLLILTGYSRAASRKKIYIDQFLFTDNTPGFEHNAQLLENGEKRLIWMEWQSCLKAKDTWIRDLDLQGLRG